MTFTIGLDIGGTKIAGAMFDPNGSEIARETMLLPKTYEELLSGCGGMVAKLDAENKTKANVGISTTGVIDCDNGSVDAVNIPYLKNHFFVSDCAQKFGRAVSIHNDADCAAYAEAMEGAAKGRALVFGLTMGTGVGGGFVMNGKLLVGRHNVAGEVGHIPLPYREESDGELVQCNCGQKGCIDKSISGPALARFYERITGEKLGATAINDRAGQGDKKALDVLDRFFTIVAKAMIPILHLYDPDIITVSGGLSVMPGLYDEIPKRWAQYAMFKTIKTEFVQGKLGAVGALRGAALLSG